MLLDMTRQILHLTTILREPVLPQDSSLSFQEPHCHQFCGVSLAPDATHGSPVLFFFFRERKRTPTNAKRRTALLGIAVHFLILRCLVSSGLS